MRFLIVAGLILLFFMQLCIKVPSWRGKGVILLGLGLIHWFFGPWWVVAMLVLTIWLLVRPKPKPTTFVVRLPTRVVE